MISFFRRALSSWIVLGLLGLIMIAFIVTGVGTPSGLGDIGGGASGDTIAKVGKIRLGAVETTQRVQIAHQNVQQQSPEVDMATFAKGGGVDDVVNQLISAKALEGWARSQGIGASKRLVDGDIASMPAFKGPTGQFDEGVYRSVLSQRRLTDAQVRSDLMGDAIRRQILIPVGGGSRAPESLVKPYASLMLETRKGQIGIVPSALMQQPGTAAPTEADINAWYSRNLSRYTMPERRVIRYALIGQEHLGAVAKPTEAEITDFYNRNSSTYSANETRSFSQVVLPDEAAAKALTAKVKAGGTFAAAAQAAGFAPTDTALGVQTRAQITDLASKAVADAAFSAPQGGVTPPMKSALGWHVIHVDSVKQTAGRSLAAAHAEIAASIEKQKTAEAIADFVSSIEDQVADGASFDDVVKARKLTVVTTPPLLPAGQAPDQPGWKAPAELQILLKAAFEASPDDDPTVENIGNGTLHALLKVGQIVPAAPVPLAKIRDQVANDFQVDRAFERARAVAKAILAKTNSGVPLAKAIADAGLKLPPPQPAGGRQIDIAQAKQQVPPPLALMFSLSVGNTRMLEAPNKQGWFLVHLDSIEKGDASTAPGLIQATRNEFNGVMGQEFLQQFVNAVEKTVGVKRNDTAIAKLKTQLSGAGSQ